MKRVCWMGWSNKGFNFEVCHDEVMISDVESIYLESVIP